MNKDVLLLVDESYKDDLCAVCIVCIHGKNNLEYVIDQTRQISVDPVVTTYNKSGVFHYADDSIAGRQSLVQWIYKMPISVYLAISRCDVDISKQDKDKMVYTTLFPELLKPLKIKFRKKLNNPKVSIRFENLSNKLSNDEAFFKSITNDLSDCKDMTVGITTKCKDSLTFLPDYFLGFIGSHLQNNDPNITWSKDALKLLSEKVGLILFIKKSDLSRFERGDDIISFLS